MINLAKRVIHAAIRRAGYEVMRQQTLVERRPAVSFALTSLPEYRRETESIPGMIAPESADILYALCLTQDVQGDVLEIGSWQGKSTSYLGRAVKDSRNGRLFAVDHFRGNVGKEGLYRVGREDLGDLRGRFDENMARLELDHIVTTLASPSKEAYTVLVGQAFRFLFIDGDHTETGVQQDIELFCPLVLPGGLVVFDDFDNTFPGLVRAVERWVLRQHPLAIFSHGSLLVCKI